MGQVLAIDQGWLSHLNIEQTQQQLNDFQEVVGGCFWSGHN